MNLILSFFLASLPLIDEQIPDGAFGYAGLFPREVITVDPKNSPLLQVAYQKIKSQLNESLSEEEILLKTLLYVQDELFELDSCTPEKFNGLIQFIKEEEIPLERFLENKLGLCRHLALCTTYLIDLLIKDQFLDGEVFLIRDYTIMGRHGWCLYLSSSGAWHLDALLSVFENGKTLAGFSNLRKKYGMKTMERQKLRWENGH